MTNSLTSDERKQWLKQIRYRAENYLTGTVHAETYHQDVNLLLSMLDGQAGCSLCGGPHDFDTSIPSVVWNAVIRARDLPDYLCATCIVREFVRAGQGFTAELWNEEFNGVPIELIVNGQNAKDAALVQEENNSLRNQINDAAQSIVNEADKVAQLMQAAATRMREKCVEKVDARLAEVIAKAEYAHYTELADLNPRRAALEEVKVDLESLTLDNGEQEQK